MNLSILKIKSLNKIMRQKKDTAITSSWEPIGNWYNETVGKEGHYYHQNIILPALLPSLDFKNFESPALLDLACGQGVLARNIPKHIPYTGIDISPTLIQFAKKEDRNPLHGFYVGDATKSLAIKENNFSHAVILLALQNMEHGQYAIANAAKHLRPNGRLLLVLNHPCFRIPRQSSWGIDEQKKLQYRRIDRYYQPLKIPIQAHPGKGEKSPQTWSFHQPLSGYVHWLAEAGFVIDKMDELCSDKNSTGKNAKMENRARDEFPLFMIIRAIRSQA